MKITFGVPVYNVERYIDSCIESIINQSTDDFEILIVDDGTPDNSGRICDEYAKKDSRVRVIHQENMGVSSVRNRIIHEAEGDWIIFVDGDDKLVPGAYSYARENIDKSFDIVYFDLQFFVYDNSVARYTSWEPPLAIWGEDIKKLALSTMYSAKSSEDYINKTLRSVCAKAFKKDFLITNGLKVDERLIYGEDVLFNLECLKRCRAVKLVRKPFYLYRHNPSSMVRSYNSKIMEHNTMLSGKLYELAGASLPDSKMMDRYYLRCISDMASVLKLDICHRNNPCTFKERERHFKELLKTEWCRRGLDDADTSELTDNDSAAYSVIATGDFSKICRYYKQKDKKEALKRFINRIGLNRLLKPIRDKCINH